MPYIAEPKRIKKFRLSIVKQIPKFPNDRATKEALEAKSLASLLIDYANWAIRNVAQRPRTIQVEPTALNDPRWQSFSTEITTFLDKVRNGESLKPHLSLKAHKYGFSLAASVRGADVDRWADKDFLLNVMGYHHFHIGLRLEPAGHIERTNDVLFAAVTREQFDVIGLFNHSVFDMRIDPTEAMSRERQRLWGIFNERTMRGVPPGSVVAPAMITTSGHPLHFTMLADYYARVVREMDPKLDDLSFVQSLYEDAGITIMDPTFKTA